MQRCVTLTSATRCSLNLLMTIFSNPTSNDVRQMLYGKDGDVCRSWSERHLHTTKQLRDGASQELQLSTHFWLSSNCRAPLGKYPQSLLLCKPPGWRHVDSHLFRKAR